MALKYKHMAKVSNGNLLERKSCYFCYSVRYLENHHCVGGPNRPISDYFGLMLPVCGKCHDLLHDTDNSMNRELRAYAQKRFEEVHSYEEWMRIFRKNYLEDDRNV